MKGQVNVTGLRELNRGLKAYDQAPQEMRDVMKGIAEGVAQDVRHRVPRRSGKMAASYKARGGVKGASIAYGGNKAPYAPWIEFGGRVGSKLTTKRPVIRGGRYLYPTIAKNLEDVQAKTAAALNRITAKYGMRIDG